MLRIHWRTFSRPVFSEARANLLPTSIFQEQSPARRTATFRIIHQAVVYAANEEILRVQRQDVVGGIIFEIRSRTSHLAGGDFAAGSQRALCTPRDRAGGAGSLSILLVIWSPRGPGYLWRGREPAGLQIGRLTRHETPLALPLLCWLPAGH